MSLHAAANPADTDYLYFVAIDNGTHLFSSNYDDHRRAVNRYQKGLPPESESSEAP